MPEPIDVQLPAVPDHIPRDTIRDFCESLGLAPEGVCELNIGIYDVTATLHLRDRDGHKIRYGNDAATTVVSIPIR